MVQKLEDIKNGGSIKIGATGKISALISRELQSIVKDEIPKSRNAILEPKDAVLDLKLKEKAPTNEANTSNNKNKNTNGNFPKTKQNHARKVSKNPILHADNNISIDGSPNSNKKRSYIVEVVDIKCGIPEKIWANPIKDRFKKLTFSKLSETN